MSDSPLFLDYRKGSVNLALYEPLRSLLTPCLECNGEIIASGVRLDKLKIKSCKWEQDRDSIWFDSGIGSHCQACQDTGRVLTTLSSGDVSFYGNGSNGTISIGIEVKEITELLSSLLSGRLQDTQMRGMINDYDPEHRWILHYGRYRANPQDGMIQTWKEGHSQRRAGWYTFKAGSRTIPYSFLEAFKCCSAKEYGFSFVRVENIIEAAQWLSVLYHTWTRPYHTHKSMNVFDKSQDVKSRMRNEIAENNLREGKFQVSTIGSRKKTDTENQKLIDRMSVFNQFPNIGYERSKAAGLHFKSIREGVNASANEWGEIQVLYQGKKGSRAVRIGKEVGEGVVKFVTE